MGIVISTERVGINSCIYRTLKKVMATSSSSCLSPSEESSLRYLVVWIFSAINVNWIIQENTAFCTVPWKSYRWGEHDSDGGCANSEFGLVTEFLWGSHFTSAFPLSLHCTAPLLSSPQCLIS